MGFRIQFILKIGTLEIVKNRFRQKQNEIYLFFQEKWDFDQKLQFLRFLAHLSRRLKGELIVYRSIRRPLVRPWVRASVGKHFQTRISPQPVGQS